MKAIGREQRRLATLQREQREIGGDDDQGREEDRPRHLAGRGPHVLLGQFLGGLRFAPPQDVLRHHDRAVDDHAEIERAERQHARRHMGGVHQHEDGHHRQRYGHRDHQRAARAAEEQHQDDDHQADAFEHRAGRSCLRSRQRDRRGRERGRYGRPAARAACAVPPPWRGCRR